MKREVCIIILHYFLFSHIFLKEDCPMANTNNMNNFVQFSNDEISIVAKAFPLIYAYCQQFDGNDEEKFIKLNNGFNKLISEFRKSEIDNFPVLKERTERGLNNKPEAYYDFWFVSFVNLVSINFNQQNEDKFGLLFNKLTTYLSIARNIPVDKNSILDEIFHNSDMSREESILLELILRLKPHVKELFDSNQDDQLIDYLGNALPECIVKEKELIGPAIDSLSAETGDTKTRIIEDAASMLVLLAFVDDSIIRITAKEDIAFAMNSSDEECLKELERGKIAASRAIVIILESRTKIRDFMANQSLTSETKELFGEVFSFS